VRKYSRVVATFLFAAAFSVSVLNGQYHFIGPKVGLAVSFLPFPFLFWAILSPPLPKPRFMQKLFPDDK